jgi:hypothetical protein
MSGGEEELNEHLLICLCAREQGMYVGFSFPILIIYIEDLRSIPWLMPVYHGQRGITLLDITTNLSKSFFFCPY